MNEKVESFQVIKMLVLVVTFFGVCWLPLHVFILLYDFNQDNWRAELDFYVVLYYCVHWLAMSNSFVNPIIYSIFNKSFRRDLRWILCCGPCGLNSCKKVREKKKKESCVQAKMADGAWDVHVTTQQSLTRQGMRVK